MRELTQTQSFELVNKALKIVDKLKADFSLYAIDRELIEHHIPDIKGFKYPFAKLVVDSYEKKEIIPLLLGEPRDPRVVPILFPTSIRSFTKLDKFVYADFTHQARYIRERGDKTLINSLKMSVNDLYASLQIAFVNLYIRRNETKLSLSKDFLKAATLAYARLFTKTIDRTYPISSDMSKYNVSIFMTSMFFLVDLLGLSFERAERVVFSFPGIDRETIRTNCKVYRDNELTWTSFSDFLKLYETELKSFIRAGSLTHRNFIGMYVKQYGEGSYFAPEHFGSFIIMCLTARLGVNFYNDKMVTKIVGNELKNMEHAMVKIFSQ